MEQKLEQLNALLAELGDSEKFNMFVVLDDEHNEIVSSGLCGKIGDIITSLCFAFDSDIKAFEIAMSSIIVYAVKYGALDDNSELFEKIKEAMHNTIAARKKELELEKDNEE